jgi:hypothetical protein
MKIAVLLILLFASVVHANPAVCSAAMDAMPCSPIASESSAPTNPHHTDSLSILSNCADVCAVNFIISAFVIQQPNDPLPLLVRLFPHTSSLPLTEAPPRA